ncbi:MAG: trypsin-like peptidase domain-containing protein [Candidatus Omnitrophica bacterium]|nr:trypsin-like peptidase domain-containing protein [Candidatus Omnitrophota bacterium]MCM8791356.1 trypsin-like peptidase domain-containing protein [Candidatus Omnitrophota bacterium]
MLKRLILPAILALCLSTGCGNAAESPRLTPVVKVVKKWGPSVVNISTERLAIIQHNLFQGMYGTAFEEFFRQNPAAMIPIGTMKLKGIGSGVIVSEDGLIVTNAHVVHMANKIYVILADGKATEAEVFAVSPADDIAILKITPPEELHAIKFAQDVMIGETVVAIGNPFGLENSVSAGIISGTNRSFSAGQPGQMMTFNNLIQTDASINLGSSGGALFNLDGELVGINLAVVQGAQSIGFAIPASRIREILEEYKEIKSKQPVRIKISE